MWPGAGHVAKKRCEGNHQQEYRVGDNDVRVPAHSRILQQSLEQKSWDECDNHASVLAAKLVIMLIDAGQASTSTVLEQASSLRSSIELEFLPELGIARCNAVQPITMANAPNKLRLIGRQRKLNRAPGSLSKRKE